MHFIRRIRHSLSLRLLLLFIGTSIILGVALQVMLGYAISSHIKQKGKPHLEQYFRYIQQDLGSPPSIERAQQLLQTLPIEISISSPEQSWTSANTLPNLEGLHRYDAHANPKQTVYLGFERGQTIVKIIDGTTQAILWNNPRKEVTDKHHGLLLGLIILLSVLALLYLLIRRLFRPIQTIQQAVKDIGQGELQQRIPKLPNDELGQLGASINQMTDQIEQMLEAKRELLLAISHELRSPLTRAKVSTALLEPSPNQANIARDLREMENMITELLEAERLKGQHQRLHTTPVSLNEIVLSVIDEYFADAVLDIQLCDTLPLQALDPTRLRLVTRNIIDNALKHQEASAAPVKIITSLTQNSSQLLIQDHGTGIEAIHIPHLTEPFYRVDRSRQRSTGGVGLGLYLVQRIIDAHHGTLNIQSQIGVGTRVSIQLPL